MRDIAFEKALAPRGAFEALTLVSEKPEKILLRFWGFAVSREVSKV